MCLLWHWLRRNIELDRDVNEVTGSWGDQGEFLGGTLINRNAPNLSVLRAISPPCFTRLIVEPPQHLPRAQGDGCSRCVDSFPPIVVTFSNPPCRLSCAHQINVEPTSSSSNEHFPPLTPSPPPPSALGPSTPSRPPTPPSTRTFRVRYPRNLDCKREAAASRPSLLVAGPARARLSRTTVEEG